MNPKPGWLTAVCVIALVMGVLGVLSSVFGALGAVFAPQLQAQAQKLAKTGQPQDLPDGIQDVQARMQAKITEVQNRWLPINLTAMLLNLLVSAGLVLGGVKALQLSAAGRSILIYALIAAIVFHLARLAPTIGMQIASVEVVDEFMAEIMQQTMTQGKQNLPPAQQRTVQNVMATSMRIGLVIGIAFIVMKELVQAGIFAFGIFYLRKPHIRALYANQEGAALVDPID